MKRRVVIAVAGAAILASGALLAGKPFGGSPSPVPPSIVAQSPASQVTPLETVTLKVDGMWCPSCSYFVKQALVRTQGVADAKVSARAGTAVVSFDPAKADVETLIAATTGYGYPSRLLTP